MHAARAIPRARRPLAALVAVGLAVTGVLVTAAPAQALTIQVTTTADVVDPLDGVLSLREAVADANSLVGPDTVTFQPGLTGTIPLASSIAIDDGTTIDGTAADIVVSFVDAGAGGYALFQIDNDPSEPVTLRNFQLTDDGIVPQVGPGVYVINGGVVTLEDMTIFNLDGGTNSGGCVLASSLTGLVFTGTNVSSCATDAGNTGGAVQQSGGTFTAVDSYFGFSSAATGGAIFLQNSVGVSLLRTTFEGNSATSGAIGYGGGLHAELNSGDVTITDSTFTDNTAVVTGGGMSASTPGTVTITGSTFTGNGAFEGGAVTFDASDLTVQGSTFRDNVAGGAGGAITRVGGTVFGGQIADSVFESNEADEGGALSFPILADFSIVRSSFIGNVFGDSAGAILLPSPGIDNGTLTIDSSTFTGQVQSAGSQTAPYGATIRASNLPSDGSLLIVNTTIDETEDVGSALYLDGIAGEVSILHSTLRAPTQFLNNIDGAVVVENSVVESLVAGTDPFSGGVDLGAAIMRYSLSSGPLHAGMTDAGGNLFSTVSDLGALAANGGSTLTRLPAAGSPALDGGDPAVAAQPALDQRGTGFGRVFNGRVDMGAVEVQPTTVPGAGPALPPTGQSVSWWLLAVAAGVLLFGVVALLLTRRARQSRG